MNLTIKYLPGLASTGATLGCLGQRAVQGAMEAAQ